MQTTSFVLKYSSLSTESSMHQMPDTPQDEAEHAADSSLSRLSEKCILLLLLCYCALTLISFLSRLQQCNTYTQVISGQAVWPYG